MRTVSISNKLFKLDHSFTGPNFNSPNLTTTTSLFKVDTLEIIKVDGIYILLSSNLI